MTVGTVFLLAAVAALAAFARDLVSQMRSRGRRLTQEERASLRDPIEVRGMIMDNTRDAVALQSALLLDLRQGLGQLRDENTHLKAENTVLRSEKSADQLRIQELYAVIGQMEASQKRNDNA